MVPVTTHMVHERGRAAPIGEPMSKLNFSSTEAHAASAALDAHRQAQAAHKAAPTRTSAAAVVAAWREVERAYGLWYPVLKDAGYKW